MASSQHTIKLRRGPKADLELIGALSPGEVGFCLDTKEVFIGDGTKNHFIGRVLSGLISERPQAGDIGRLFLVIEGENSGDLYFDTGQDWFRVVSGANVKWSEIDEKPTEYPAAPHRHDNVTPTHDGFMSYQDKKKLDDIEPEANKYIHPETHPVSMVTGLAPVATSGSYTDLKDKPDLSDLHNHTNKTLLDAITSTDITNWNNKWDYDEAVIKTVKVNAAGNADTVNGLTVETAVPLGAEFTDTVYTHPDSHPANMIDESTTRRFVSDAEKAAWNAKAELSDIPTKISTFENDVNYATMDDLASTGYGDMLKSVYDKDNDGTVDNAAKVNGHTVEADVPANAKFTDTVYTHPSTHPASMITGFDTAVRNVLQGEGIDGGTL